MSAEPTPRGVTFKVRVERIPGWWVPPWLRWQVSVLGEGGGMYEGALIRYGSSRESAMARATAWCDRRARRLNRGATTTIRVVGTPT